MSYLFSSHRKSWQLTLQLVSINYERKKVIKKNEKFISLKCISAGLLENNKGVHLENREINLDFITPKDLKCIELAKKEGGEVIFGGNQIKMSAPYDNGFYIEPTVIEGLPYNCKTNQEEIFGPVVTIMPFETEEEAIQIANSTEYGLATTIWTNDLKRAHRVADTVHAGIIWINAWLIRDLRTPFGGVKSSGVGREGGWEALRFFTEPKNIFIKISKY